MIVNKTRFKFFMIAIFSLLLIAFNIVSYLKFPLPTLTYLVMNSLFILFLFFILIFSCKLLKNENNVTEKLNKERKNSSILLNNYDNLVSKLYSIFEQFNENVKEIKSGNSELNIKTEELKNLKSTSLTIDDFKNKLQERTTEYNTKIVSFLDDDVTKLFGAFKVAHLFIEIYIKIPYLNKLLNNVIEKTENAALTLIEKFDVVFSANETASKQAKISLDEIHRTDAHSIYNLINESKKSINKDQGLIKELVVLNEHNQEEIKKMQELIQQSGKLLTNIIDLSKKNKVISINLSIEAVKAGENGGKFKVIVDEIQKINQKNNQLIREMRNVISNFQEYSENVMKERIQKTSDVIENLKNESEQSEKVNTVLISSYEQSNDLYIELSKATLKVNKSMSDILESLQFQDIIRQQIEHIIGFLEEIKGTIENGEVLLSEMGVNLRGDNSLLKERLKVEMLKDLKVREEKIIVKNH